MKWKILFFVFFLVATATVSIAATQVSTAGSKLSNIASFDFNNLALDGLITPNGGGDPLPGGGIPR